jgi:precorrin-2 dehydrogenase/sirohydrochlorin ferrochelatase
VVAFLGEEFRDGHLEGALLVIAATDDPVLNRRVSERAKEMGILVNAVDQPEDCSFIVPSILRRGELVIAVSTSGKSPALAKKVREEIGRNFGPEYESFLVLMGKLREQVLSRGLAQDQNMDIFRELVYSRLLEAIREKDWNGAASILNEILDTQFSPSDVTNFLRFE